MPTNAGYPSPDGNDREAIHQLIASEAYQTLLGTGLQLGLLSPGWPSRKLPNEHGVREFVGMSQLQYGYDKLLPHVAITGKAWCQLEQISNSIGYFLGQSDTGDYNSPLEQEAMQLYQLWYGNTDSLDLPDVPDAIQLRRKLNRYCNGDDSEKDLLEQRLLIYLDGIETWLNMFNKPRRSQSKRHHPGQPSPLPHRL